MPKPLSAGLVGIFMIVAACAHTSDDSADRDVALHLTNSGTEPLRCSIAFGHWVYRDLGILAPGQAWDIAMIQAAKDGALYINRFDGERQMMIENLLCGRMEDWRDSVGQIDLAPVRSTRVTRIGAKCAVPTIPGRVACEITEIGR